MSEVARLNGGVERLDVALLLGQSYQVALETLAASQQERREFRFDGIYPHIHFLPLDGVWGPAPGAAYPAILAGAPAGFALRAGGSHLWPGRHGIRRPGGGGKDLLPSDGDIARLLRFKEALWGRPGKFEVLCFPQQAGFVGEFLEDMAGVKVIQLDVVEERM